MKNSILNFGEALNKAEQKLVNGGGSVGFFGPACHSIQTQSECSSSRNCVWYDNYCDGNVPHIVINP